MLSIANPKKGILAYLLIFDTIDGVSPSMEKIIYDTYDILTSINYIMEAEGCIISDVNNVNKPWKRPRREAWRVKDTNHGRKRVLMLANDDYGKITKKKCTKMHMVQRKCSLSYHGSCFIVMM